MAGFLLALFGLLLLSCGSQPPSGSVGESAPTFTPGATPTPGPPPQPGVAATVVGQSVAPATVARPTPQATPIPTRTIAAQPTPAEAGLTAVTAVAQPSVRDYSVARLADQSWASLERLTEEMSPRTSATDTEKAAAEYLLRELKLLGYQSRIQPFTFQRLSGGQAVRLPGGETIQIRPLRLTGSGAAVGLLAHVGLARVEDMPQDGLAPGASPWFSGAGLPSSKR